MRHLFIVPSLACPAGCKYCFGPHEGNGIIDKATVEAIVMWQKALGNEYKIDITFHGGEPLTAGINFFKEALPILQKGLAPSRIGFGIQSNLWLLTDELCEVFSKYKVSIGTSIDGPEHINDMQRGEGYFKRTMEGIKLAKKHGINVGCICTFTKQSLPYYKEIFNFFASEGLNFTIHAAMPSIRGSKTDEWTLTPGEHSDLFEKMFELYTSNMNKLKMGVFDSMIKSVSTQHGGTCTFGDCLGGFLTVGPDGTIYPCQRLAGISEFGMGSVYDFPSKEDLTCTPVWRMFENREKQVEKECENCSQFKICKGGCPYNALVENGGNFDKAMRDPHCEAYRHTFKLITDKAMEEVFSKENMEAVINSTKNEAGLMRRGRLISIMKGDPHPSDTARNARMIIAAAAISSKLSPEEIYARLQQLGDGVFPNHYREEISALHKRLYSPETSLNNIYLHVTFGCNLKCTHCYAEADVKRKEMMKIRDMENACLEAAKLGFSQVVITGGEPLVHPQRIELLKTLSRIRNEVKPMLIVLRTNFAQEFDDELLHLIGSSTDQLVVSLDGSRETHDLIRGSGSYDITVKNLIRLKEAGFKTDVSLAAALTPGQVKGSPGESVRELAAGLGIKRTRFKPILPIGRARETMPELKFESLNKIMDPAEALAFRFNPAPSCGIGQNLYVEPGGDAYPCYAWSGEKWNLGNIFEGEGLRGILTSAKFKSLGMHTVNTNYKCSRCPVRFLCGGACKVWNDDKEQEDLDAAPGNCSHLLKRVQLLIRAALDYFGIEEEKWIKSGFEKADFKE